METSRDTKPKARESQSTNHLTLPPMRYEGLALVMRRGVCSRQSDRLGELPGVRHYFVHSVKCAQVHFLPKKKKKKTIPLKKASPKNREIRMSIEEIKL